MNRFITIAACLAVAAATVFIAFFTKTRLDEAASLPPSPHPTLPTASTPPSSSPPHSPPAASGKTTPSSFATFFAAMQNGDSLDPPSRTEIEAFLDARQRSAEALLTAFSLTHSNAYLDEALDADPDNPQLHLAAAIRDFESGAPASPWIDRLLESDPENPLASWLAADDSLAAGDIDAATAQLHAAADKRIYKDYLLNHVQNAEEFYTQQGNPPPVAKARALYGAPMPHLQKLNSLRSQLHQSIQELQAGGQTERAHELAALGIELGNRLSQGDGNNTLISELVGLSYEKKFLKTFDQNQTYSYFPQPIPEMLESIEQQIQGIRDITVIDPHTIGSLSEADATAYFDRFKLFGEREAMQWLNKHSITSPSND